MVSKHWFGVQAINVVVSVHLHKTKPGAFPPANSLNFLSPYLLHTASRTQDKGGCGQNRAGGVEFTYFWGVEVGRGCIRKGQDESYNQHITCIEC